MVTRFVKIRNSCEDLCCGFFVSYLRNIMNYPKAHAATMVKMELEKLKMDLRGMVTERFVFKQ